MRTASRSVFSPIILLLAAAIVLPLLSGCEPVLPDDTSELVTTDVAEAPKIDFASAEYVYKVVRPDKSSDEFISVFTQFMRDIRSSWASAISADTDWLAPGKEAYEYEILIGNTNRPETAEALSSVKNSDYIIRIIGNKLIIAGWNEDTTAEAIRYFTENIIPSGPVVSSDLFYSSGLDYPVGSIEINGKSVGGFTVVYSGGSIYSSAADSLIGWIEKNAGYTLTQTSSVPEGKTDLILISGTGKDGEKLGYDDGEIYFRDGSLCFAAGSSRSAAMLNYTFESYILKNPENAEISLSESQTFCSFRMPSRDAYIADPSLMPVHWTGLWEPSERMLDYDVKVAALMCTDKDHLFTVSHRGDFLYYPENSIEAMISVWLMGGDCVEIDIHYTKDGVPVVIHDATLTRTTDFSTKAGKNGLPSSANVSDWTLDQIRQLRLLDGQGGSGAEVTPYLLPTLEEAMIAAKGRFFIILDKQAEWRYADIPGLQPKSAERFIYPLMKSTGNFESILISYGTVDTSEEGTLDAAEALKIQKYFYDNDGQKTYFYLRGWTTRGTAEPYAKKLAAGSLTNSAVLVNGAFDPNNNSVLSTIKSLCKNYPGTMFGGWTIDSNGYDCEQYWKVMYNAGMRSIMTNNMFALVQFAATKFK